MRNKISKNLRIAISGKSGCGNSTISKMVAEKLNYNLINYTFHNMANESGIEFEEFCKLVEKDSKYDKGLDKKQLELAKQPGCVLGSRLAIWLLKDADLKVYLTAVADIRAKRIAKREGIDFDESYNSMMSRDKRDRRRFINLYNIDINNFDFADLIINTDNIDQQGVVKLIIDQISSKGL